jgi:hypothetical protein
LTCKPGLALLQLLLTSADTLPAGHAAVLALLPCLLSLLPRAAGQLAGCTTPLLLLLLLLLVTMLLLAVESCSAL